MVAVGGSYTLVQNEEIDHRVQSERMRWSGASAKSIMTASTDWLRIMLPFHGVPRPLLDGLLREDMELWRMERFHYLRGNSVRLFHSHDHADGLLFATGPMMNCVSAGILSSAQTRSSSSSSSSRLGSGHPRFMTVQDSVDLSSTVIHLSPVPLQSESALRSDQLVVASMSTPQVHLLRLSNVGVGSFHIDDLQTIPLGQARPFPSFANNVIQHECAILAEDGRMVLWDASAMQTSAVFTVEDGPPVRTVSNRSSIDGSLIVVFVQWLRGAYAAHPRVVLVASQRAVRRIDVRDRMQQTAREVVSGFTPDGPAVITAFDRCPADAFRFALVDWSRVALYDERYTSRPLLQWLHHRNDQRHDQVIVHEFDSEQQAIVTYSSESSAVDVYRFASDGRVSLGNCQALDTVAGGVDLCGLAISSDLHRHQGPGCDIIRLTGRGTLIGRQYRVEQDTNSERDPCPRDVHEEPCPELLRSTLVPFDTIDMELTYNDIIQDDGPALQVHSLESSLYAILEDLVDFLRHPRPLPEVIDFIVAKHPSLNRLASRTFFDGFSAFAAGNGIRIRTQVLHDTVQCTAVGPTPDLPPGSSVCTCSVSDIEDGTWRPRPSCRSLQACTALCSVVVDASASIHEALQAELFATWAHARMSGAAASSASSRVDLSLDINALIGIMSQDVEEQQPSAPHAPRNNPSEDPPHEMFEKLTQTWQGMAANLRDDRPP